MGFTLADACRQWLFSYIYQNLWSQNYAPLALMCYLCGLLVCFTLTVSTSPCEQWNTNAGLEYNLKLFFVCQLNSQSPLHDGLDSLVLPTCSLGVSSCPQPSWWPLPDHALPYSSLSLSGESKTGPSTLAVLDEVLSREKGSFVPVFAVWLLVQLDVGASLPEGNWLVVPGCHCSIGYC